jgi:hypothetical protein
MAGITYPYGDSSAKMNHILSTSLWNAYKDGVIQDNAFIATPTVDMIKTDCLDKEDGGERIGVSLMYDDNSTVKSVSPLEELDYTIQDGITTAWYEWKQYHGSVVMSDLQRFQNSGKTRIANLFDEKVKQTLLTWSTKLAKDLWDIENLTLATTCLTGNDNKNINSIPLFIQDAPASAYGVGGILQSTYAWWRNQKLDFGATDTLAAFEQQMLTIYNMVIKGRGGAKPASKIISDMYTHMHYVIAMQQRQRYLTSKKTTAGFESVGFYSADYFWDPYVPDMNASLNYDSGSWADGSMFLISPEHLRLKMGKGEDFRPGEFKKLPKQLAYAADFMCTLQLVCGNRSKLGLLADVEDGALT